MSQWWLTEYNGVSIPAAGFDWEGSRAITVAMYVPTGSPYGAINLNGIRNRLNQQTYRYTFTYPSRCDFSSRFEALLGASPAQGVIKKSDGLRVLQTTGNISNITDQTTMEDWISGLKRATIEIMAEPFWYGASKTVPFTAASTVNLNTAATRNEGNARAVKNLVLTFTTNITATAPLPFIITLTPQSGTTAILQVTASLTQPIVIAAGASTVTANAVNSYDKTSRASTQIALLFLEGQRLLNGVLTANNTTMTFVRNSAPIAMSGNLTFRDTWI